MITEIGIVAGEIWHFLDKHGEVDLDQLVNGVDKSRNLILMSLGWLAREGHVVVNIHDKRYRIILRCEKV
ncbi:MAG: winged helix-turn-helix domain-containing protein [Candidatus Omnitrophota bacterium]|nr:winged helix-turn-helix domain-containing protein [Candidatus Omnitrophota bacterium]